MKRLPWIGALLVFGGLSGCLSSSDTGTVVDVYTPRAFYSLSTDTSGNQLMTLRFGNAFGECGAPTLVGCSRAAASITLPTSQLEKGAVIELSEVDGYMEVRGQDDDGMFPPECSYESGAPRGRLRVTQKTPGRTDWAFELEGTGSRLDARYDSFQCDEPEPHLGSSPAAVFHVEGGNVVLSWGNVARTCDDGYDVQCGQVKKEASIPVNKVYLGRHSFEGSAGRRYSTDLNCAPREQPLSDDLKLIEVTPEHIGFVVDDDFEAGYVRATRCP